MIKLRLTTNKMKIPWCAESYLSAFDIPKDLIKFLICSDDLYRRFIKTGKFCLALISIREESAFRL